MPAFVEDPTKLSKSRLRSELVARSVGLPPAESRKEVYVELFLKHVDRENAADFSSDEEEPAHHAENKKRKDLDGAETPDPRGLTDDELKAALLQHGVKAGPIVGSTRALYERRLQKLLQSDVRPCVNGADDAVLYSDSEEEEEDEEEEEESDLEQAGQETLSHLEQTHEESCQECVEGVLGGTFPATGPSPTGIIATRRRPIKGAAGRPIQYKYPDPPASPLTREREEVERRLVPVYIQILVFVIVACLLYLVYACMEETSYNPFMSLLDDLSEEALTLRDQTQDVATLDSFD